MSLQNSRVNNSLEHFATRIPSPVVTPVKHFSGPTPGGQPQTRLICVKQAGTHTEHQTEDTIDTQGCVVNSLARSTAPEAAATHTVSAPRAGSARPARLERPREPARGAPGPRPATISL